MNFIERMRGWLDKDELVVITVREGVASIWHQPDEIAVIIVDLDAEETGNPQFDLDDDRGGEETLTWEAIRTALWPSDHAGDPSQCNGGHGCAGIDCACPCHFQPTPPTICPGCDAGDPTNTIAYVIVDGHCAECGTEAL